MNQVFDNSDAVLVGIYLVIGLIGLLITIAWIMLPFLIISRLDKLIAASKQQAEDSTKSLILLGKIEQHIRLRQ